MRYILRWRSFKWFREWYRRDRNVINIIITTMARWEHLGHYKYIITVNMLPPLGQFELYEGYQQQWQYLIDLHIMYYVSKMKSLALNKFLKISCGLWLVREETHSLPLQWFKPRCLPPIRFVKIVIRQDNDIMQSIGDWNNHDNIVYSNFN